MIATEIEGLIASGTFKKLLAGGIISPNVKTQFDIYQKYVTLRHTRKGSVRDIVCLVAEDFKVAESTVYTALKTMRQE